MAEPGVLARCGSRPRPGRGPGARRRCRRSAPASLSWLAGRFVTHRLYRQPSSASNKVSCAPGCGRSRRAKTRIVGGPALQLVPGRALAQQPGQLGDVRFFDPAGPVRAAGVAAGVIGAALADLAAAVDGDLPGLLRDQPQRGLLPLAQRPADRVDQLIAAAGGQLIQVLDQLVAGPGPVAR